MKKFSWRRGDDVEMLVWHQIKHKITTNGSRARYYNSNGNMQNLWIKKIIILTILLYKVNISLYTSYLYLMDIIPLRNTSLNQLL